MFKAALRVFKWYFILFVITVLGGALGIVWLFDYYGQELPSCHKLKSYAPPLITRFYASTGDLIAEYSAQKRVFLPIKLIPSTVIRTVLAAEDRNFYQHSGLNFFSILRALASNIAHAGTKKRPLGASTITQQVAKNFLLRSNKVSWVRKVKEAILAFRLEKTFSKDEILELYLNEIYWGRGAYGIAAAALVYFNKSLQELNFAETAFLAGLPQAPSRYQPDRAPQQALRRRNWVLSRMQHNNLITAHDAKTAQATPLRLVPQASSATGSALYFSEHIRRQLVRTYGEKFFYEQGLTVRTTLNLHFQHIAQNALRQGLEAYDKRHGWRGALIHIPHVDQNNWVSLLRQQKFCAAQPTWLQAIVLGTDEKKGLHIGLPTGEQTIIPLAHLEWAQKGYPLRLIFRRGDILFVRQEAGQYHLEQVPQVQGAIIVLNPQTGRILASVGGYDWYKSQFDRAVQAMRQAGSTFKPFVYLAALEKGLSPTTLVQDEPFSLSLGRGLGTYTPQNITKRHYGPTTLRVALEQSRNVVTVRLGTELVGLQAVADTAEKFNLIKQMPLQPAMTLGAGETTLLSLTTAYGMIANGGRLIEPVFIDCVHDRQGKVLLPLRAAIPEEILPFGDSSFQQIAHPVSVYQLISLLEGAIQRGTASALKGLNAPALAGKTGTSSHCRDGWFVGFLPNLVVGVFVGHDDFKTLGDKEVGSKVALPIFASFLQAVQQDLPPALFSVPSGVHFAPINRITGTKASPGDSSVIFEALRTLDPREE